MGQQWVLSVLPRVVVVRAEELRRAVKVAAEAVGRSFRNQGLLVLSWRKSWCMVAKWLGQYRRTVQCVLIDPRSRVKPQLYVLAFDPLMSPHYKVVRFTGWKDIGCEIEVFRSEKMEWGVREVDWGVEINSMPATMHYFGGKLYTLAYPQHLVVVNVDEVISCQRMIELP